jgi:hypothetical protein
MRLATELPENSLRGFPYGQANGDKLGALYEYGTPYGS